MAFLTTLTLVIAAAGLFLMSKVFSNFQPGERRIQADLEKMRTELKPYVKELVPIDKEELELFSQTQINQLLKKGITTTARGVFTTIYNEPIAAYSYKKYVSSGINALLYVRIAHHEFAYRIRNKGIQVVIDNQLVGTIKNDGILYGARSKKALASINKNYKDHFPVIVQDREVASLAQALPENKKGLSARAFDFVKDDINKDEETIFLSLAVLELIQRSVGEK